MAGLHIFRSNRLEVLVAVLAERLRPPGRDPMQAQEVVVGSRGMERHLRQALAEHLGICANVRFPFPTAALDEMVPEPLDGLDPWSPDALAWALLEVIPSVAADPSAEPLRRYLAEAPATEVDARTWGLARRLADTLDRYLTFRPELVAGWDQGRVDVAEGHRWQVALWRAARAHVGHVPHRGERLAALERGLADGSPSGPLHVFGLTSLAGTWLQALGRVARHRSVDLYLLCPSDAWWADLGRHVRERPEVAATSRDELGDHLRDAGEHLGDAGHPLLLSWGRTGRDLQILLESLPDGFEEGRSDLFVDPLGDEEAPTSALRLLQADVLAAVHPSLREDYAGRRLEPTDRSLQIHACHGPTRQVEVLRTVLLELLDADPTLQPRDVVVMTPDVDGVAPLVGAVFDGASTRPGAPYLPWELADLSIRRLNPVADALLRVLELVDGRAAASDLLDLLALDPVADRFGLGADDVTKLGTWVTESGIRWGADAAHRAAAEQPRDAQNTWRFGLDRLLLGVLVPDDGRLPAGIRPFDAVEGGGARLLGKLADYCAAVFDAIERLRDPRPLAAWVDALEATLESLTLVRGHESWLGRRVRDELDALRAEAEASRSARPQRVDAVRAALTGRFEVASAARHGAGGAVTFCGMVPERAVPYRVVCLLGMDEGSFPRGGARSAFDLVQQAPRVGDRDPRDEDRYLLLEALLSARDHLVVLYTGRDPHTNEPRPPAVPVSELLDALDSTFPRGEVAPPSERLSRQHPLQAFDARDFTAQGGPPFSYDAHLLAAVRSSLEARTEASPFLELAAPPEAQAVASEEPLHLDDLVWFWRHPLRTYMQRTLSLRLPRDGDDDVPDREPLELGPFDRGRILEAILEGRDDAEAVRRRLRAAGALPLGRAGDVLFDALAGLAEAMRATAAEIGGWAPDATSIDLDLAVEGYRLSGRVDGVASGALVLFRYGDERCDALLEAWIRLLAATSAGPAAPGRALLVFGKAEGGGEPEVKPIGLQLGEAPEGPEALAHLVRRYRDGFVAPLPFLPRTSHAVAKAWLKAGVRADAEPDEEAAREALKAARSTWTSDRGGEAHDRYNHHAFGVGEPFTGADGALDRAFVEEALRVWGPVLAARRTKRDLAAWGGR